MTFLRQFPSIVKRKDAWHVSYALYLNNNLIIQLQSMTQRPKKKLVKGQIFNDKSKIEFCVSKSIFNLLSPRSFLFFKLALFPAKLKLFRLLCYLNGYYSQYTVQNFTFVFFPSWTDRTTQDPFSDRVC